MSTRIDNDEILDYSSINQLQGHILRANVVTTPSVQGSDLQIQSINVPTAHVTSGVINNTSVSETVSTTDSLTVSSLDTSVYSVDTLNLQSIHIENLNVVQTLDSQTVGSSGSVGSTNTSATTSTATDVNTSHLSVTGSTNVSGNFVYNDTKQTSYYSAPSQGAFRGICFFQNLDIGIGQTNTVISMNMRSESLQPYLCGYNTFLNDIDKTTSFDGTKAILSLCAPTSPASTLRWQENGNLAIYNGGTKVWQNGSMVSDIRLKTDIEPITSAMNTILKLDGVNFTYKWSPGEKTSGVLLEQVEEHFPYCVTEKSLVHLEKLVPLIVEGLKELNDRNKQIAKWINSQKDK